MEVDEFDRFLITLISSDLKPRKETFDKHRMIESLYMCVYRCNKIMNENEKQQPAEKEIPSGNNTNLQKSLPVLGKK